MHIAHRSLSFWSHRLAVSPGARSLSSLLAALIRDEHRWCEDPIESALFIIIIIIIRDRAPMVRGPYWICSVYLLLLLLLGTEHRWCEDPIESALFIIIIFIIIIIFQT